MVRKLYLVCYDVRDPARLNKTYRIIRAHASGGQKSVHECWLNAAEKTQLVTELEEVMDWAEDSLLLIPLRANIKVVTLGKAVAPLSADFIYFG